MKISFDYHGCYLEHKEYFDAMARSMQQTGHQFGIITGVREIQEVGGQKLNNKDGILANLGFKPDFFYMWGEVEAITNGNMWKAQKMDIEGVLIHYDDDATEIKKYTDRWVIKVMNSADRGKF